MLDLIRSDLFARLSAPGGLPSEPVLYLYKQNDHGQLQVIINALTQDVYEGTSCAVLPYVVDLRVKDVSWYVFVSPGLPQEWGSAPCSPAHVTLLFMDPSCLECEVWHVQPTTVGARLDAVRYAGYDWCHPLEGALVDGGLKQQHADLVERWACSMRQRWSTVLMRPDLPPPYNPLCHEDVPGFQ